MIFYFFLAPSNLYKSKCGSLGLSVTFYFFWHNSVNFHARTSRFCMEVDLDNTYEIMMMNMTIMMMMIMMIMMLIIAVFVFWP